MKVITLPASESYWRKKVLTVSLTVDTRGSSNARSYRIHVRGRRSQVTAELLRKGCEAGAHGAATDGGDAGVPAVAVNVPVGELEVKWLSSV